MIFICFHSLKVFIYFLGVIGQGAVKPAPVQNYTGKFTTTFLFNIYLTSTDWLTGTNKCLMSNLILSTNLL